MQNKASLLEKLSSAPWALVLWAIERSQRSGDVGWEAASVVSHCLAGENPAHHGWCAQETGPVPYPAWRPPHRHQKNVWAINCLQNFLTLAAVYYFSLALHHQLEPLFHVQPGFPVLNIAVAPVPRLLSLPLLQPRTCSLPLAQLLSTSWSFSFCSLCLQDKSNNDVSFPPKHTQILVPDIHFTLDQAQPGNQCTSEYHRFFTFQLQRYSAQQI